MVVKIDEEALWNSTTRKNLLTLEEWLQLVTYKHKSVLGDDQEINTYLSGIIKSSYRNIF